MLLIIIIIIISIIIIIIIVVISIHLAMIYIAKMFRARNVRVICEYWITKDVEKNCGDLIQSSLLCTYLFGGIVENCGKFSLSLLRTED
jgi:hypothetical protein